MDRDSPAALAALLTAYGYHDIGSFIQTVTPACGQQRKTVARAPAARAVKTRPAKVEIGCSMVKATKAIPAPTEQPSRPSGTSLDDSKNFGLLADFSPLETTGGDTRIQQTKLTDSLKFAQQVLHTTGFPAAI